MTCTKGMKLKQDLPQQVKPWLVLFLQLVESLKNVNNRLINHLVSGYLVQLQILRKFYLIELLRFLIDLGLLKLWHLIFPSLMVFFTKSSLLYIEFHFGYLALFCLFSVIDSFEWFLMGNPRKHIQLMLEFIKAPFVQFIVTKSSHQDRDLCYLHLPIFFLAKSYCDRCFPQQIGPHTTVQ